MPSSGFLTTASRLHNQPARLIRPSHDPTHAANTPPAYPAPTSPGALKQLQAACLHTKPHADTPPPRARTQAELLAVKEENSSLHTQLQAAEAAGAAATARVKASQLELQRAQLAAQLARTECDGLTRLVALLEREQEATAAEGAGAGAGAEQDPFCSSGGEAMAVDAAAAPAQGSGVQGQGQQSAAAAAKLAAAQAVIAELKAAQEQLQGQLAAATAAEAAAQAAAVEAAGEAKAAIREAEQLALRCQALEVGAVRG